MNEKKDELLKKLIEELRPLIEREVAEILEQKRRENSHVLEDIRTGPGVNRQSFIDRSIKKCKA